MLPKTARGTNPKGTRTGFYRSKFEASIASSLKARSIPFKYEDRRLGYVLSKVYTPDFTVGNLVIEAKGWFKGVDRTKLLAVKTAHPQLDIRLVFQRASTKLYKGSNTTYAMWADTYGFPWAEGSVPDAWIK